MLHCSAVQESDGLYGSRSEQRGAVESDRSHSQLCDLRKGICYSEPLLPLGHIDRECLCLVSYVLSK